LNGAVVVYLAARRWKALRSRKGHHSHLAHKE